MSYPCNSLGFSVLLFKMKFKAPYYAAALTHPVCFTSLGRVIDVKIYFGPYIFALKINVDRFESLLVLLVFQSSSLQLRTPLIVSNLMPLHFQP